jgi:hypothetical protein
VQIKLDVRNMAFRRPDLSLETRTDPSGNFRFELGDFRASRIGLDLKAHSPRYRFLNRIVEIDDVELPYHFALDLEPGVLARGRVMDESGNPLGGVEISHQQMPIMQSGSDGTWEVFGLASPRDRLTFGLDGYVRESLMIETASPGIHEGFEVVLRSSRTLDGVVLSRQATPVPRAQLRLTDGTRFLNATANETGSFQFKALPAGKEGFRLLTQAEGFLPAEMELQAADLEKNLQVILDSGIMLTGRTTLPSGQPAPGTRMIATTAARSLEAMTDRHGEWRVGPFGPREEVKLFALPKVSERGWGVADLLLKPLPGKEFEYEGDVALWPQGHTSTFSGSFKEGRVRLEREDQGATGFPDVVVYSADWDGQSSTLSGTLEVPSLSQSGRFTLTRQTRIDAGLGGVWELREQVDASMLQAAPVYETHRLGVLPGRVRVDVPLDTPLQLAGRVLKEDGKPFLDGRVTLRDWDGTPYLQLEAPISVDGRFSFPRVPRGTFTLLAHDGERETFTSPLITRGGVSDAVLRAGPPPADPIDE